MARSTVRAAALKREQIPGIGVLRKVLGIEDGEIQRRTIQRLKILVGDRPCDVAAYAAEGDAR